MGKKQRNFRADLRKNRNVRTRKNDLTREFSQNNQTFDDMDGLGPNDLK